MKNEEYMFKVKEALYYYKLQVKPNKKRIEDIQSLINNCEDKTEESFLVLQDKIERILAGDGYTFSSFSCTRMMPCSKGKSFREILAGKLAKKYKVSPENFISSIINIFRVVSEHKNKQETIDFNSYKKQNFPNGVISEQLFNVLLKLKFFEMDMDYLNLPIEKTFRELENKYNEDHKIITQALTCIAYVLTKKNNLSTSYDLYIAQFNLDVLTNVNGAIQSLLIAHKQILDTLKEEAHQDNNMRCTL